MGTAWLRNGIYLAAYALMLPAILYRRIAQGRALGSLPQRLLGRAPRVHAEHHCVWLHAVSVGEVILLQPLLAELQLRYPKSRFVISTTTATGMSLARQEFPGIRCFYFPIDFSWAVRSALRRVQPDVLVLTELEVWPNLVACATAENVPVVVINGRLSERSFHGYWRFRRWLVPTFAKLSMVLAQSEEYAQRFVRLGCPPDRVHVVGSIKFDGACRTADSGVVDALRQYLSLQDGQTLWVAGSTQEPEEWMVASIWAELAQQHSGLRLVIVPRHPHRGPAIRALLSKAGWGCHLKSQTPGATTDPRQILIADTIGELKAWWSLADVAFVGGSFGDRGGQNMLEPAACGAAVCFGPNTWNFKQIVDLLVSHQVATQVSAEQELHHFVQRCLRDRDWGTARGQAAQQLVESSQGALSATCRWLAPFLETSVGDRVATSRQAA